MKELCSYPWVRDTYGDAACPTCPGCRSRASTPARRAPRDGHLTMAAPCSNRRHRLRTRRRTQDRPGRHRQPARAHARRRAAGRRNARPRAARARSCSRAPRWSSISAACRPRRTSPPRARCSTALRDAGVLPVALAYGTQRERSSWRAQLGLPLLAKFRAQYEPRDGRERRRAASRERLPSPMPRPPGRAHRRPPAPAGRAASRAWCRPRRCAPGQQVYAREPRPHRRDRPSAPAPK